MRKDDDYSDVIKSLFGGIISVARADRGGEIRDRAATLEVL